MELAGGPSLSSPDLRGRRMDAKGEWRQPAQSGAAPEKGHPSRGGAIRVGGRLGSQGQATPPLPSSPPTPGLRFQKGLDRSPPLCRAAKHP